MECGAGTDPALTTNKFHKDVLKRWIHFKQATIFETQSH